jgi:hypothetical protein
MIAIGINIALFLALHLAERVDSYWKISYVLILNAAVMSNVINYFSGGKMSLGYGGTFEKTEANKGQRKFLFFMSLFIAGVIVLQIFGVIGELRYVGLK